MRVLLPLYGFLGIQSFGLCVTSGLLICVALMNTHPLRTNTISVNRLYQILIIGIWASLLGGKALFLLRSSGSGLAGFSLLGSIGGFLLCVSVYIKVYNLPLFSLLDLFAIHAPLLQAISRLGCFFAGCCYGTPTKVFWSVLYTDPLSFAPLNRYIHPTQLYSAGMLLLIFIGLRIFYTISYIPGNPSLFYLGAVGLERFIIDFFRGDRDYLQSISFISVHQLIALVVLISSLIVWYRAQKTKRSQVA